MFTFFNVSKFSIFWICLFPVEVNGGKKTIHLTANRQRGVITSPNYPQPYGGSYSIEWNIFANSSIPNAIVHMEVIDSELSMVFTCYEDIVEVMDGPSSMYSVIKDWCGDSYPSGIIKTSGDTATVSFGSNLNDNNYRGFKIEYWAETNALQDFGPVHMTPAHWTLVGLSAIIYGFLIGGCLFLVKVELKSRQKGDRKHRSTLMDKVQAGDELSKHVIEHEKLTNKKRPLSAIKNNKANTLPPISKTIRPTMNIRQWKNMLSLK